MMWKQFRRRRQQVVRPLTVQRLPLRRLLLLLLLLRLLFGDGGMTALSTTSCTGENELSLVSSASNSSP